MDKVSFDEINSNTEQVEQFNYDIIRNSYNDKDDDWSSPKCSQYEDIIHYFSESKQPYKVFKFLQDEVFNQNQMLCFLSEVAFLVSNAEFLNTVYAHDLVSVTNNNSVSNEYMANIMQEYGFWNLYLEYKRHYNTITATLKKSILSVVFTRMAKRWEIEGPINSTHQFRQRQKQEHTLSSELSKKMRRVDASCIRKYNEKKGLKEKEYLNIVSKSSSLSPTKNRAVLPLISQDKHNESISLTVDTAANQTDASYLSVDLSSCENSVESSSSIHGDTNNVHCMENIQSEITNKLGISKESSPDFKTLNYPLHQPQTCQWMVFVSDDKNLEEVKCGEESNYPCGLCNTHYKQLMEFTQTY